MANPHQLTASDILPMSEYAKLRVDARRRIAARKRSRRVDVGPHVTFYFESYETMWLQVHEMVFIEKGGAEQVRDELTAYNPLIPKGSELVATFMIEIDDVERRRRVLAELGGIEETTFLTIDGNRVFGLAEQDQDRTTAEGKASSVHFVHFSLTAEQVAAFRSPNAQIVLGLSHPRYSHMTVLSDAVRSELATDLD
jgi:hypothetical protein